MTTTEIQPDDARLRLRRRERVLQEMEASDVDVLVLGIEANARYVAGVPRLWLAGTRPFGPSCVLVRSTGAVYLLSSWDEGVPEDIPHENLYGITFNRANFVSALRRIDGASDARVVATDAMNPGTARLLPQVFGDANIVSADDLLSRARATKSPEEIEAIKASVGVAERSLQAATDMLGFGVTESRLTGRFMEAMVDQRALIPSTQDVAWVTSREHPWQRSARDLPVAPGDLVAFEGGVILDGYVGELGRTHPAVEGDRAAEALLEHRDDLWRRLIAACRPGAPLSDLLTVYDAADVDPPPMPIARGLGLGYDMPVVSHGLQSTNERQKLEPGMVLAVTAFVWQRGVGAAYGQEPVAITANGVEVLTTKPFCST